MPQLQQEQIQLQLLHEQLRLELQKRQDELSIICRHAISQCNDSLLNALISFHTCIGPVICCSEDYFVSELHFWFMQTKTNLLHTRTPHTYSTYTHAFTHIHTNEHTLFLNLMR